MSRYRGTPSAAAHQMHTRMQALSHLPLTGQSPERLKCLLLPYPMPSMALIADRAGIGPPVPSNIRPTKLILLPPPAPPLSSALGTRDNERLVQRASNSTTRTRRRVPISLAVAATAPPPTPSHPSVVAAATRRNEGDAVRELGQLASLQLATLNLAFRPPRQFRATGEEQTCLQNVAAGCADKAPFQNHTCHALSRICSLHPVT
jgi:hypothetical protein